MSLPPNQISEKTVAPRPQIKSFDPEEQQEKTRGKVVGVLLTAAGTEIIVMLLAWLFWGKTTSDVKDIATIIFTPTLTLLGTAIGFYFSKR